MVLFVVAPKSNFRKIDRHLTPNWSAANIGAGMLALYWLSLNRWVKKGFIAHSGDRGQ